MSISFFKNYFLIFIFLATLGLSCNIWDLVPQPEIKPRALALGAQSLNHWSRNLLLFKGWIHCMDRSEASQMALVVKNLPADAGDMGSNPGSGRSPEVGNGNPLQYSCLGNSRTEEPSGLQSMGSQRVGHGLAHRHTHGQTTFVYPFIYWWTLGLPPPLGCCEQRCYEHGFTNADLRLCFQFFWVPTQKWSCWIIFLF